MPRLVWQEDGEAYAKPVRVEDSPDRLRGLLNDTRWKILQMIAERPRYPAEIADHLDVHEQNVYYHVRALADDGFITVDREEERGGAVAKYYTVTDHGFALELPQGREHIDDLSTMQESQILHTFFQPFIQDGSIAARIVVGSPDPHGPHQVRARDTHLAADLGLFLGQFGQYTGKHTVHDTTLKAAGDYAGNLLLLGGPLTNMVTAAVNEDLPIRFDTADFPFRKVVAEPSGTTYTDDAVGFICRIPNPHDPGSIIVVVAGVRMKGTNAAVQALTEDYETVLGAYDGGERWGVVVKGKDMDGDGTIDAVDVLEHTG